MRHLIRTLHPATKHTDNPVLAPDRSWERSMGHSSGTLLMEGGVFRYWYQVYTLPGACAGTPGTFQAAYAESTDGIHWNKPELGIVRLASGAPNNLCLTDVGWINVIRDDHDPDPARRYKMLAFGGKGNPEAKPGARQGWMGTAGGWGWSVYFSPDGLHWEGHPENPVYTAAGDVATLYGWDETHRAYVAYFRPVAYRPEDAAQGKKPKPEHGWYKGGPAPVDEGMRRFPYRRLIGRATSPDFVDWSATETVLTPNEWDPPATEFYGMTVCRYQGYYIGQNYVLYADPSEGRSRSKGLMDVQLAVSRDGITWTRLGGQCPFIARGPAAFEMGMVGPNAGLVEKDGKLWFYYNGWTGEHRETKAYRRANDPGLWEMGRLGSGTGLAFLRQDGFVSLDAGEDDGTCTAHPERVRGCRLELNATTGPAGYVAAEVVADDGSVVPGYSVDDCDRFVGDSIRHVLTWRGASTQALPAEALSLRFQMRVASLYSYAVTPVD